MTEAHHDAIIVGSGAAGSFAAKELTAQGLSVLLIEAGPKIGPEHFDPARKPRKPKAINIAERIIAGLGGKHVQVRAPFFRGIFADFYTSDRDNPYTTPKGAPFAWIRGRQAGGRTHIFGRVLLRWSDDDFRSKSRTGRGEDWPISYDDLKPYYDEVETCLGLYGNADGLPQLPDAICKAPAKMSPAEKRFKQAVESRFPERSVVSWRSMAPSPDRVLKPLREALGTGRLGVRYDTVVARIVTEGSRATGVEVIPRAGGDRVTLTADHVILCASPIESVRLLLNSASEAHPGGLGNSSGTLGRYFMDQLPMLGMGSFPPAGGGWTGDDSQPKDPFYDPQGGVFIPRFSGDPAKIGHFDFQGAVGRGAVPEGEPAPLLFFGFGQMQPHATNRISLDPKRRDRWGLPVPHITCTLHEEEHALLRRQEESFVETITGAGGQVEFLGSPHGIREYGRGAYPREPWLARKLFRLFAGRVMVMGAAIHECGGARMGRDPASSVTNGWGQLWDAPNVYVTDASTFAGSGVSGTTLTIMAQSLRACRHLAMGLRSAGLRDAG